MYRSLVPDSSENIIIYTHTLETCCVSLHLINNGVKVKGIQTVWYGCDKGNIAYMSTHQNFTTGPPGWVCRCLFVCLLRKISLSPSSFLDYGCKYHRFGDLKNVEKSDFTY